MKFSRDFLFKYIPKQIKISTSIRKRFSNKLVYNFFVDSYLAHSNNRVPFRFQKYLCEIVSLVYVLSFNDCPNFRLVYY